LNPRVSQMSPKVSARVARMVMNFIGKFKGGRS
jgi:hypothetical protein